MTSSIGKKEIPIESTFTIPFEMSHTSPETKVLSSICPLAHHPALFLILHLEIIQVMPNKKSESEILSSAHHPALFFIQTGIGGIS